MTDRTLSLKVSSELHRALSDLAHENRTDMSKIARPWLRAVVLAEDPADALPDDPADAVPDHLRADLEREQLMEQNSPKWDRIHFPSRTAYQFRQAFENGDLSVAKLGDAAVEEMREIYVEEARRAYDDPDLQDAAVEFVHAVADHAAEAADASEFDALDPEQMFETYAGVEEGREVAGQREQIDRAAELIEQFADSRKVVSKLRREFDLTGPQAQEIFEKANREDDR